MNEAVRPLRVKDANDLLDMIGRPIGPSAWLEVTQADVDAFGRAVHDWHWAHNDPDRAAQGPFGGPIAHAHLTMSIIPHLRKGLFSFASGECMFYGYDRVRFPTPVPVGAQVRAHATVTEVDEIRGGEQLTTDVRIEIRGSDRPGCLAQWSGDITTSIRSGKVALRRCVYRREGAALGAHGEGLPLSLVGFSRSEPLRE